jgi:hypothetical protein
MPAFQFPILLLLLALGVRIIGVLVRGLRVLLRTRRMLLALGVVALAVMFGSGSMCFGSVFVMFGGLVVLVSCHGIPRLVGQLPVERNSRFLRTFLIIRIGRFPKKK